MKLLLLFLYLKQNDIMDHFNKRIGKNGNCPYLSNLIVINTKLQRNLKRCVNFYLRHVGELFNQFKNVVNLRSDFKWPVLDQFPLRLARTRNLYPRFTRGHSQPIVFTPHGDANWNFLQRS